MHRTILVSTIAAALLGSAATMAQAQQPAPQMNPETATFFIADNPNGTGNLGGIAGADQMCQSQAQAIGGRAATRTWHAYVSQEQRGNTPRVNARDRIGTGPWFNVKGQLIASSVGDLHGDQPTSRDRNNIQKLTALDAKGNEIPGVGSASRRQPARHDDRFGSGWPCIYRRTRPHLQQLDLRPDVARAAEPERTGRARSRDARPQRPFGRREHVMERGPYEPRLHQAVADQHRRRRPALLLRDQLIAGNASHYRA